MVSSLGVAILRMHQLTTRHRRNVQGVHGTGWVAVFILLDGLVLLGVFALMSTQVCLPSLSWHSEVIAVLSQSGMFDPIPKVSP